MKLELSRVQARLFQAMQRETAQLDQQAHALQAQVHALGVERAERENGALSSICEEHGVVAPHAQALISVIEDPRAGTFTIEWPDAPLADAPTAPALRVVPPKE